MAERQGVQVSHHPSPIIQYSYSIEYSSPRFTTIRRILVSNLVSNKGGPVPGGGAPVTYMSLTQDWTFKTVKLTVSNI